MSQVKKNIKKIECIQRVHFYVNDSKTKAQRSAISDVHWESVP